MVHRRLRNIFKVLTRFDFSPIGCRQSDRYKLIELWKQVGYREGVEIGVHRGHFSGAILDGIPDVKMHCIDPWETYPESKYTQTGQNRNYTLAMKRLQGYGDRVKIYKDYSENVVSQFKDKSLDFVFIDGAHWFDACMMDIIKWVPKVKKGGMVGVHDYLPMVRGGVIHAVDAYTYCHKINPWFVTREEIPTAFWVVE